MTKAGRTLWLRVGAMCSSGWQQHRPASGTIAWAESMGRAGRQGRSSASAVEQRHVPRHAWAIGCDVGSLAQVATYTQHQLAVSQAFQQKAIPKGGAAQPCHVHSHKHVAAPLEADCRIDGHSDGNGHHDQGQQPHAHRPHLRGVEEGRATVRAGANKWLGASTSGR